MIRDRWRVYICPKCGELYVYPGVCDNRSAHEDTNEFIVTIATTVKAVDVGQDELPAMQQHEGVQSSRASGTG